MNSYKILVVEDDFDMLFLLYNLLERNGYQVEKCNSLTDVLDNFASFNPDIVLLDRMVNGIDSYTVLKQLRESNENLPILVITGVPGENSLLDGFTCGASDYIKKPFSHSELLARIKAHLHDHTSRETAPIALGEFVLDPFNLGLTRGGQFHQLTVMEYNLAKYLIENKNRRLSVGDISKVLWNDDDPMHILSLRVYITKIRSILDEDPSIRLINIRSFGYMLKSLS